ncbi:MAG: FHA domain-containing protein [Candidatus Xenobia bacterium]
MNLRVQAYLRGIMTGQTAAESGVETSEPWPWAPIIDSGMEIIIEEGQDRGKSIPLDCGFLMVGREEYGGEKRHGWLLFADRTVSRRQALFLWSTSEQAFRIYHLGAATNPTVLENQPINASPVRAGQHVKMGHLGFRVHNRAHVKGVSGVVRTALQLLGDYQENEAWVNTGGLALTVLEGEGTGTTFILNKKYHVVGSKARQKPGSPPGTVWLSDNSVSAEQAVLVWVESSQSYALIHNRTAGTATWIYRAARDNPGFPDPNEPPMLVNPESPLYVHPGDAIAIGNVKMLVHKEVGEILEQTVQRLRGGDALPAVPSVAPTQPQKPVPKPPSAPTPPTTAMSASTPVPAPAAAPPRPAPSVVSQPVASPPRFSSVAVGRDEDDEHTDTVRWMPNAEWALRVLQGGSEYVDIPILTSTLTSQRVITIGAPGRRANDVQLDDPSLVNETARLEWREGQWSLIPESDEVSIFVNGQEISERTPISLQDEVIMGAMLWSLTRRPVKTTTPQESYVLEVLHAPGLSAGTRMPIDRPEMILGRDKACHIVFNDATVSRRHAAIALQNRQFWLQPLSGTNPTFVNGVQVVKNRILSHGDEIQLSRDTLVRFVALHEEVF